MMKQLLIKNLHAILKPLGFVRKSSTWNRKVGDFVDVINLQTGKCSSDLTVNFGVLHPELYMQCWAREFPIFVYEYNCTVRSRIGSLINDFDKWWELSDEKMPIEVPQLIQQYGLPFLDSLHSIDAIEGALEKKLSKMSSPQPPEEIYLAIIKAKKSDFNAAYVLLDGFEFCISEGWKTRAQEIKAHIKSTH